MALLAKLRVALLPAACLALACITHRSGGSDLINAGRDVPLLPDGSPAPEPCPEDAKKVMKALRLRPGEGARIEIDLNQFQREPLTLFPGPIESITLEPMGNLEGASHLYGRVWAGARSVVIRYYRAQLASGEVFPICAVARRGGAELEAKPGKFPKSVELPFSNALAFIVEDFL